MKFGNEEITCAQLLFLSSHSYAWNRAQMPPLLAAPSWAQGLMGTSGTLFTVLEELRRCPFSMKGIVVADLGAVNIILGMFFIKA